MVLSLGSFNPMLLIILLVILIGIVWFMYGSAGCISKCVPVHSEFGQNYPWLKDINDGLNFIEYKEPSIGANNWTRYTDQTWKAHCSVISHDPDNLVKAHQQAFLVDNSPIKLRFNWNNGTKEELQNIPQHLRYYELEAQYFKNNGICHGQKNSSGLLVNP